MRGVMLRCEKRHVRFKRASERATGYPRHRAEAVAIFPPCVLGDYPIGDLKETWYRIDSLDWDNYWRRFLL